MNQTREEFLRRHTEHAQRLDDLAGELQTLDLSGISHKVGDEARHNNEHTTKKIHLLLIDHFKFLFIWIFIRHPSADFFGLDYFFKTQLCFSKKSFHQIFNAEFYDGLLLWATKKDKLEGV